MADYGLPSEKKTVLQSLAALERREVITTDPEKAAECCGIERDEDGFCQHRPAHPVYVPLPS